MNSIVVKGASITNREDIDAVVKSGVQTLRKTYRPNQKALLNKSKIIENLQRLVALIDDKIVGTVQYYEKINCLSILGLYVHSEYRRIGVAGRLVDSIESIAIKKEFHKIALYTVKETGNDVIFGKFGFSIIAEEPDEYSEGYNDNTVTSIYMEKKI